MGLHLRAGLGPVSYGKTLRFAGSGSSASLGGSLSSLFSAFLIIAFVTFLVLSALAGVVGSLFGLVYVVTNPVPRTKSDGLHVVGYLVIRVLAVLMLAIGIGLPIGVALGLVITENFEYALWLILAGVLGGIATSYAGLTLGKIANLLKREEGLARARIWPWGVSALATSAIPLILIMRWAPTSDSDWAWLAQWLAVAGATAFVTIHGLLKVDVDHPARTTRRSFSEWALWIASPALAVGGSLLLVGW